MSKCNLCPRKCNIDRSVSRGFCGVGEKITLSKVMLHHGEEPCISGANGSGALFFSGCNLRCVFCQNASISRGSVGEEVDGERVYNEILSLQERGAHNINLVTATHHIDKLISVLSAVKPKLDIPIIYNTSAYEKTEVIAALAKLVDVYLPDYKYYSSDIAAAYSAAPDYPEVARAAIARMLRNQPKIVMDNGLIRSGVIIRHLVLPSHRDDSIAVMRDIAKNYGGAAVSIMRQYTPQFNSSQYKNLNRKLTSYEYDSVVAEAQKLGLDGYIQQKGCENALFTPDFSKIY